MKSDVNLAVLDVLEREGVEIPFPQRVVRVIDSREPATAPTGAARCRSDRASGSERAPVQVAPRTSIVQLLQRG